MNKKTITFDLEEKLYNRFKIWVSREYTKNGTTMKKVLTESIIKVLEK